MTNYSESYIEDLTVEQFKQQEGFQRAYVKKIQNHVNLLVSQNAGFILFNAGSSRYKKQVKNPRL